MTKAKLTLSESLDALMGLDRCVFMTHYFNTGDANIFVVVNNDVTDKFYLVYEEDDVINNFEIGSRIALKRLIHRAYRVDLAINPTTDHWWSLPTNKHIEAKKRAYQYILDKKRSSKQEA